MTRTEAKKRFNTMRKALAGLDKDFLQRIFPDLKDREISPECSRMPGFFEYGFKHEGMGYEIFYKEVTWQSKVTCCTYPKGNTGKVEYMTSGSKPRMLSETKRYGSDRYKYSIEELAVQYIEEPFYLNHLTKEDLEWYASAVQAEMEDWDYWLKEGDISQDKRDEHLASTEKRILHEIAPYMNEIQSVNQLLKLFERK